MRRESAEFAADDDVRKNLNQRDPSKTLLQQRSTFGDLTVQKCQSGSSRPLVAPENTQDQTTCLIAGRDDTSAQSSDYEDETVSIVVENTQDQTPHSPTSKSTISSTSVGTDNLLPVSLSRTLVYTELPDVVHLSPAQSADHCLIAVQGDTSTSDYEDETVSMVVDETVSMVVDETVSMVVDETVSMVVDETVSMVVEEDQDQTRHSPISKSTSSSTSVGTDNLLPVSLSGTLVYTETSDVVHLRPAQSTDHCLTGGQDDTSADYEDETVSMVVDETLSMVVDETVSMVMEEDQDQTRHSPTSKSTSSSTSVGTDNLLPVSLSGTPVYTETSDVVHLSPAQSADHCLIAVQGDTSTSDYEDETVSMVVDETVSMVVDETVSMVVDETVSMVMEEDQDQTRHSPISKSTSSSTSVGTDNLLPVSLSGTLVYTELSDVVHLSPAQSADHCVIAGRDETSADYEDETVSMVVEEDQDQTRHSPTSKSTSSSTSVGTDNLLPVSLSGTLVYTELSDIVDLSPAQSADHCLITVQDDTSASDYEDETVSMVVDETVTMVVDETLSMVVDETVSMVMEEDQDQTRHSPTSKSTSSSTSVGTDNLLPVSLSGTFVYTELPDVVHLNPAQSADHCLTAGRDDTSADYEDETVSMVVDETVSMVMEEDQDQTRHSPTSKSTSSSTSVGTENLLPVSLSRTLVYTETSDVVHLSPAQSADHCLTGGQDDTSADYEDETVSMVVDETVSMVVDVTVSMVVEEDQDQTPHSPTSKSTSSSTSVGTDNLLPVSLSGTLVYTELSDVVHLSPAQSADHCVIAGRDETSADYEDETVSMVVEEDQDQTRHSPTSKSTSSSTSVGTDNLLPVSLSGTLVYKELSDIVHLSPAQSADHCLITVQDDTSASDYEDETVSMVVDETVTMVVDETLSMVVDETVSMVMEEDQDQTRHSPTSKSTSSSTSVGTDNLLPVSLSGTFVYTELPDVVHLSPAQSADHCLTGGQDDTSADYEDETVSMVVDETVSMVMEEDQDQTRHSPTSKSTSSSTSVGTENLLPVSLSRTLVYTETSDVVHLSPAQSADHCLTAGRDDTSADYEDETVSMVVDETPGQSADHCLTGGQDDTSADYEDETVSMVVDETVSMVVDVTVSMVVEEDQDQTPHSPTSKSTSSSTSVGTDNLLPVSLSGTLVYTELSDVVHLSPAQSADHCVIAGRDETSADYEDETVSMVVEEDQDQTRHSPTSKSTSSSTSVGTDNLLPVSLSGTLVYKELSDIVHLSPAQSADHCLITVQDDTSASDYEDETVSMVVDETVTMVVDETLSMVVDETVSMVMEEDQDQTRHSPTSKSTSSSTSVGTDNLLPVSLSGTPVYTELSDVIHLNPGPERRSLPDCCPSPAQSADHCLTGGQDDTSADYEDETVSMIEEEDQDETPHSPTSKSTSSSTSVGTDNLLPVSLSGTTVYTELSDVVHLSRAQSADHCVIAGRDETSADYEDETVSMVVEEDQDQTPHSPTSKSTSSSTSVGTDNLLPVSLSGTTVYTELSDVVHLSRAQSADHCVIAGRDETSADYEDETVSMVVDETVSMVVEEDQDQTPHSPTSKSTSSSTSVGTENLLPVSLSGTLVYTETSDVVHLSPAQSADHCLTGGQDDTSADYEDETVSVVVDETVSMVVEEDQDQTPHSPTSKSTSSSTSVGTDNLLPVSLSGTPVYTELSNVAHLSLAQSADHCLIAGRDDTSARSSHYEDETVSIVVCRTERDSYVKPDRSMTPRQESSPLPTKTENIKEEVSSSCHQEACNIFSEAPAKIQATDDYGSFVSLLLGRLFTKISESPGDTAELNKVATDLAERILSQFSTDTGISHTDACHPEFDLKTLCNRTYESLVFKFGTGRLVKAAANTKDKWFPMALVETCSQALVDTYSQTSVAQSQSATDHPMEDVKQAEKSKETKKRFKFLHRFFSKAPAKNQATDDYGSFVSLLLGRLFTKISESPDDTAELNKVAADLAEKILSQFSTDTGISHTDACQPEFDLKTLCNRTYESLVFKFGSEKLVKAAATTKDKWFPMVLVETCSQALVDTYRQTSVAQSQSATAHPMEDVKQAEKSKKTKKRFKFFSKAPAKNQATDDDGSIVSLPFPETESATDHPMEDVKQAEKTKKTKKRFKFFSKAPAKNQATDDYGSFVSLLLGRLFTKISESPDDTAELNKVAADLAEKILSQFSTDTGISHTDACQPEFDLKTLCNRTYESLVFKFGSEKLVKAAATTKDKWFPMVLVETCSQALVDTYSQTSVAQSQSATDHPMEDVKQAEKSKKTKKRFKFFSKAPAKNQATDDDGSIVSLPFPETESATDHPMEDVKQAEKSKKTKKRFKFFSKAPAKNQATDDDGSIVSLPFPETESATDHPMEDVKQAKQSKKKRFKFFSKAPAKYQAEDQATNSCACSQPAEDQVATNSTTSQPTEKKRSRLSKMMTNLFSR
ncbi:fap1 adhesin-like [Centroberyx affinis]|uniref:fap1 adhesin-like n=1 Tax=Centroberyx affinis TaxID=166261 RepID=UPI003A5B970D